MTADPARDPTGQEVRYYPNLDGAADPQRQREKARYDELVEKCRPYVGVNRLHFVTLLVNDAPTFSVDVFDDGGLAGHFDGTPGPDTSRKALLRVGHRFVYDMKSIDDDLRDLQAGRLVRTVLDVGTAGVYWYWLHGDEYLLGITLGGSRFDDDDRAMIGIADSMLQHIHRETWDYGGFRSSTTKWSYVREVDEVEPRVQQARGSRADDPAVRYCKNAVHVADLHYVAVFADGSWQFSVDVLDGKRTKNFGDVGADRRRGTYQQLGQRLGPLTGELDRELWPVTRHGPLFRIVLNVRSGCLYYYSLGSGRYAVGVTLFPRSIAAADACMRTLVEKLRAGS